MKKEYKSYKSEMVDYLNINEYFSFFGNIVYISTGYYYNEDYFILLKNNNSYTLNFVSNDDRIAVESQEDDSQVLDFFEKFDFENNDSKSVMGFNNMLTHIVRMIDSICAKDRSKSESRFVKDLIKIKRFGEFKLAHYMVEDLISVNNQDLSLPKNYCSQFNIVELPNKVLNVKASFSNVFDSKVSFNTNYVLGQPFIDFEFFFLNKKVPKRLYFYDICELDVLFYEIFHNKSPELNENAEIVSRLLEGFL